MTEDKFKSKAEVLSEQQEKIDKLLNNSYSVQLAFKDSISQLNELNISKKLYDSYKVLYNTTDIYKDCFSKISIATETLANKLTSFSLSNIDLTPTVAALEELHKTSSSIYKNMFKGYNSLYNIFKDYFIAYNVDYSKLIKNTFHHSDLWQELLLSQSTDYLDDLEILDDCVELPTEKAEELSEASNMPAEYIEPTEDTKVSRINKENFIKYILPLLITIFGIVLDVSYTAWHDNKVDLETESYHQEIMEEERKQTQLLEEIANNTK